MGKYFTVKELCASETAKKKKIDNTPSPEVREHLEELIVVLDQIREAWGSPIIITSGYRCPKLNTAVGGSKTSSHMTGYAVDMHPKTGNNRTFHRFVEKWLLDNNVGFDQIINEYDYSWTHLGIKNSEGKQRRQSFSIK